MSDFEDQMNGMLAQVGGLVNLTVEEREEVTKSGADVLKKELETATRTNHFNPNRRTDKMKHLADSYKVGQLDGDAEDGSTAVGFEKKDVNHARIARFLNDGTVKMKGDSFYDKAVVASRSKVENAIQDKLAKVQQRKARE
ncbi:hypothetical protein LMG30234_GAICNKDF_00547 [Fructobacillus fructosus]|uniref:HK97-gp10 family putative phage morphogenesis protein n=1 Tax=Fructobacillus fructosus TaxID=1631 RepID=UPI002DAA8DC9|nr:hypothetical protein LMG30234_GAICNKDF_00547 [Fructobacillus fructosus]